MPQRTRYCSRCLTTFPNDVDRCPNLSCRAVRPAPGWGELLEPGEVIDRTYRVRQRLAIGGAGVTYLAREVGPRDDEVGPLLAVKVLYQQRDQGPYLRRLATEAQILQGLNHAQIVECRGFVHRTGHSPYLVTRFEAGGSLLDHIRNVGLLSIPVTAQVGRQVCWALEVAHRQHVVHRDLKPENVLLVKQVPADAVPSVRVADFGIAKVMGGVGDRLTRVGAFIGTPQYAAPEQFEGLTPEPAADVYALGAMLYFCMTGRAVADFQGELDPEDLRAQLIRSLPVTLAEVNAPAHLRRWMEDTLAQAMAVEPGDRCDLATLDRRLADIAAERDPGHIPVAAPRDLPTPTQPASGLDRIVTGPAAVAAPPAASPAPAAPAAASPAAAPAASPARPALPLRRSGADSPDAVVPDPAAGTADPSAPPPEPPPLPAAPPPRPAAASPAAASQVPQPIVSAHASFPPPQELRPPPPLRPTPFPDEPAPKKRAGLALGLVAALGVAGFVVVAAAGGLWWAYGRAPALLSATDADPKAQEDWRLTAAALGTAGVAAERACKTPPYLQIEATLAADGAVQHVDLLNYDYEPARACIEQELRRASFPRARAVPARVAVTLQE